MRFLRVFPVFVAATVVVVACGSDNVPSIAGFTAGVGDAGSGVANGLDSGTTPLDAGSTETATPLFTVGGTVTGLHGTGLVLQDNAGDDLPIAGDGTFTFAGRLLPGAAYAVSIKTQASAPTQTCTLSAETGTVGTANVTGVVVNCAVNEYTVGGAVTGLAGTGLTLLDNKGADIVVTKDGTFAFPVTVASGGAYAVTVKTQPTTPSQTCEVASGAGTVISSKISDVAITCTTNKYTIGGSVAGLAGTGLVLKDNNGDPLSVTKNGTFTFATSIASGTKYAVTVDTQPTSQSQKCVVVGDTSTVGGGNVTSVAVNCTTNKFTIAGTVSGLLGTVVLQNNKTDDLTVNANDGSFAFATPIDSNTDYAVSVKTQPGTPSQTCSLDHDSGKVAGANITNVGLTCVTNTFKVSAHVTGLAGAGLVLQDNGADDLAIDKDGTYDFATAITSGQKYKVAPSVQPKDLSQTCTVTNGEAIMLGADVVLEVACVTNSFTVGGAIAGLVGSGLVLTDNTGDDLTIPANATSFTFGTNVLSGQQYAVAVKTQPTDPSQKCTVSADSGTVSNGNVVTVAVNCTTNSFTVGGNITGLVGTGLVLQDNLKDDLTVNNGANSFAFGTPIASGQKYGVTVKTQPTNPSQTCLVASDNGTVGAANVTDVAVSCTTNKYSIGGTITGLTVAGLVLQDNNGDDLTIPANATSFTFATKIASKGAYAVKVKAQPAAPTVCIVSNDSGSVVDSDVTSVTIKCGQCATNDVYYNGKCYYLDGSGGQCDVGYARASQSILSSIASSFVGLNYRHSRSGNCCIWNADPVENWGFAPAQCNAAGPFTAAPVLGGTGCTGATNQFATQLTFCGTP